MKTTGSNRKIGQLITAVRNESLVMSPPFQRRLVWKSKDKQNFLKTVLEGYPFPEIYIATGEINLETGSGTELLVDGQQRVSTLYEYFNSSSAFPLGWELSPYESLSEKEKTDFLQYDVVVRDLGALSETEIIRVFQRINSTSYSLNAMEIRNSAFDGEFKLAAEQIAALDFFSDHKIFSVNQIRRMEDTRFILVYIATIMSTYFHRDGEVEQFLEMYNEEFIHSESVIQETKQVIQFIEECDFDRFSRAWKLADAFSLLVEVHRAVLKGHLELSASAVGAKLKHFYHVVDNVQTNADSSDAARKYLRAAQQATNDRSSRITRGEIVAQILRQ